MARSDKKRREKRRAAEATQQAYQAWADLHRPGPYPEIVFETSQGNGYFVAEVKAVVKTLDFDSPEMGPDWMRQFYRRLRAEGSRAASRWLKDLEEETLERLASTATNPEALDGCPKFEDAATHLGDRIFERLPIETRRRFLPMNDFTVDPTSGKLVIRFSSLLEEPGEWGTVYYSRLLPKVEVSGKRVTVAFSDHAIRQLCARRKPRYLTYGANGDAHTYLAKCVYHEVVRLSDGSHVIRLWDCCDLKGFLNYKHYVVDVFGEENRKSYAGKFHHILGYCPFVLDNGFAKAKSFLYPGFRGTPERELLENGGELGASHAKWLDEVDHDGAQPFCETEEAVQVTQWLHENGMPQVAQMTRDVLLFD